MTDDDQFISSILDRGEIVAPSGRKFSTNVGIAIEEARYLRMIVRDNPSIVKTLEVGCALGISSIAIGQGLQGRSGAFHTIVDPRQTEGWESIGVDHVTASGFKDFALIEDGSQFALPTLAKVQPASLDFVFIDGWHTFDHTLLDMFYANLLLKVGGLMTVDDASWRAVAKAITYWEQYPCYELVSFAPKSGGSGSVASTVAPLLSAMGGVLPGRIADWAKRAQYGSMVTFRKTAEDARSWDWYAPF